MHQFLSIIMLFCSAVAGAQPAPPAAPAAGSSATHEVRDRASGQTMTCACRASGQGSMTCDQCAPQAAESPRSSIQLRGGGTIDSERALWGRLVDALRADETINRLTSQVALRAHGVQGAAVPEDAWYNFTAEFRCRRAPSKSHFDRRTGYGVPLQRVVADIRAAVEHECRESPRDPATTATPTSETVWGGCPAQDAHDRRRFQRTANDKIRLTAQPDSNPAQWVKLRDALIFDDLIYRCSRELLIDPASASYGDGNAARFRANVTLVCANEPHRSGEFDTGVAEMDAGTFRRYVGQELRRICGISAATARRGAR